MVKAGDKFIIEVKEQVEPKLFDTGLVAHDGGAICFFEDTLKQCERCNETEAYEKGYAKAMEDIQNAVRMLLAMDYNDKSLYFGGSHITAEILREFDVREIIERIQLYEKEKSKIRVGDEVEIIDFDSKAVVTLVHEYERRVFVLYYDGSTDEFTDRTRLKKTGRHFDEVEKLIEVLKGGDDSEQILF